MFNLTFLVFYAFFAFGLAWVLGHSRISLGPRIWLARRGVFGAFLADLVECPACLGVWIGWPIGAGYGYSIRPDDSSLTLWMSIFVGGLSLSMFTAGVNFLLGRVTRIIELE